MHCYCNCKCLCAFFNCCFWPYQSVQIGARLFLLLIAWNFHFLARDNISTFCVGLFHFQPGRLLLRSHFWWFSLSPWAICISLYFNFVFLHFTIIAAGTTLTVFFTRISATFYCNLESQLLGGQSLLNPRYLCLKLSEMIDFLDNLYFFLLGAAHRWLSLTRIAAVAGLDRHQSLCARNSGGCNCCIWILLWLYLLYLYFVFGAVSHRGCLSLRLLTGLDRRQSLCACNSDGSHTGARAGGSHRIIELYSVAVEVAPSQQHPEKWLMRSMRRIGDWENETW